MVAACVCASWLVEQSIVTSGPTPPARPIAPRLSAMRERSARAAAARSGGVPASALRPSPSRTTRRSIAPAWTMAERLPADLDESAARASAALS